MQPAIHPKYFDSVEIKCSCGNVIIAGSTREKLKTELCSKCHPFYTGTQKLVDTAGRVDKFTAKRRLAESMREETKARAAAKVKQPEIYKEKEIPVEVIERATKAQKTEVKSKWGGALGNPPVEEVKKDGAKATKTAKAKKPAAKKTAAKKPATKAKKKKK